MQPLSTVVNISIIRCCKSPRSAFGKILGIILSYWGNTYFSSVWIFAVRHWRNIFFNISHGKKPYEQDCILVFSNFVPVCNINFENIFLSFHDVKLLVSTFVKCYWCHISQVILQLIVFSKKSHHNETGQLICKAINWLISIWYEFLLKGISEQTIVQIFFKDMLLLKNKVILIPWKYLAVWHYLLG